jgi:hypothetical protein
MIPDTSVPASPSNPVLCARLGGLETARLGCDAARVSSRRFTGVVLMGSDPHEDHTGTPPYPRRDDAGQPPRAKRTNSTGNAKSTEDGHAQAKGKSQFWKPLTIRRLDNRHPRARLTVILRPHPGPKRIVRSTSHSASDPCADKPTVRPGARRPRPVPALSSGPGLARARAPLPRPPAAQRVDA